MISVSASVNLSMISQIVVANMVKPKKKKKYQNKIYIKTKGEKGTLNVRLQRQKKKKKNAVKINNKYKHEPC